MAINYPSTYYNRFDPFKNYKKLLFLSGQGLQAAELNEVQETVLYELKKISSFLITNGTIITGGEINAINTEDSVAHILAAEIYADGVTISVFERSNIPIDLSGITIIGMAVVNTIITDNIDVNLRESDITSPNFGQPGSYRLSQTGIWKSKTELTSNEIFYPVVTIVEGQIASFTAADNNTNQINTLIGNYDYETNGSYILNGFKLKYSRRDGDNNYVINISSGKCRVLGQVFQNHFLKEITLDDLTDKKQVDAANFSWQNNIYNYILGHNSISKIISAMGISEHEISVIHGSYSGCIDFVDDALITITQVSSLASGGGTVYVENTSYQEAIGGNSIDWSPAGAEPTPGSTYFIKYRYINIVTNPASITVNSTKNGIEFPQHTNLFLADNIVIISYQYILNRTDRISINSSGGFIIQKGIPGYYYYYPPTKQENLLSLATVTLKYNVAIPEITIDTTFNFTYDQITALVNKINTLEYNFATLSLLENARSTDPTTNKKNLIVDPLYDNDMRDTGKVQTFVIIKEELNIGSNLQKLNTYEQQYTLTYVPVVALVQDKRSDSRKINPYAISTDAPVGDILVIPYYINTSRQVLWNDFTINSKDVLMVNTPVKVILSRFAANENILISFHTSTPITVTSNSAGQAEGTITVPFGTSSGSYKIRAVGVTSKTEAVNIISISITIKRGETPPEPPPPPPVLRNRDPVAQSFTLDEDSSLNSVSVFISELPSQDILLRIVKVKVGLPDITEIIGFGRKKYQEVIVGWNNIPLDYLVSINSDVEYAVIIFTNTLNGAVGVSRVGRLDFDTGKLIASQSSTGVFFTSSNLSTWKPIQEEDLTYKLYRAQFSENRTITLFSMLVSSVTDWYLSGFKLTPIGTEISYFLEYTDSQGYVTTKDIPLEEILYTSPINGDVKLKTNLTTNNLNVSPVGFSGLTLYGGNPNAPGTYYMRIFTVDPNTNLEIKLVCEVYEPAGSIIRASITLNPTTTPILHQLDRVGSPIQVGDGWIEVQMSKSSLVITELTNVQLAITGTLGGNTAVRPKVRKIRVLIQ